MGDDMMVCRCVYIWCADVSNQKTKDLNNFVCDR